MRQNRMMILTIFMELRDPTLNQKVEEKLEKLRIKENTTNSYSKYTCKDLLNSRKNQQKI